ncbi:MAG: hypothetical protein KC736_03665 [Candidatus Moranbacteria bacterium]|nr:hypothetical protein [Candidatus Moranbacteria bacterium]
MEQIVSAIALFFVLLALQYVSIVLRMFVSVPFFLEVFFFLTFIGLLVTFFSCLFRLVHAEKMVARVQKIGLADIVLTGLFTTTFSFSCSIIWSSTTF